MKIDRNKHNIYVANTLLKTTELTTTDTGTSTGTGSTTIIYTGGGSGTGLTPELSEKLDSIESGALVNLNAFSYLTISNGKLESTLAARVQTDTAKLTILGEGVTVELVTEVESPERTITSTGIVGEYKVSYHKVETEVEVPSEEGEPTKEIQITWPLTITYVSGTKIKLEDFDTLKVVYNEVDTILTDYTVLSDTEGITSITKDLEGLVFDKIVFTKSEVDEEGLPITNEVMVINAYTISYSTIKLTSGDTYWKLDEDGNLYTTYNAYSTQELSAYGLGGSSENPEGGARYLYQLLDVDKVTATTPMDKGILQYNATTKLWEVTDGSDIKPDLTDYATIEYVTTQITELINVLKGTAPEDMDTLGEIASVITTLRDQISSIEVLLEWFEWDEENNAIKALFDLYGVGEISAYGYGTGQPDTGVSYLKDLRDVDTTNLINDGILLYNSTTQMWEVVDGSSLLIDTTEIELAITKLQDDLTTILNQITEVSLNIGSMQSNITNIQNTITEWTPTINNINDWFSFVDGKILANYDFYSIGEVSAYGAGDDSGSTGVSWLRDLEDVTLDPVIGTGDLLSYNGSVWVNIDKSEVGLNETELNNYLTENDYITRSMLNSSLSSYVTLTMLNTTLNNYVTQTTLIDTLGDYVTIVSFNQLKSTVEDNTSLLNQHTSLLTQHTNLLEEHTDLLNDHTVLLNNHLTIINGHTALINNINDALDLLNDMFEWDNGKIKAKADLYSVGEISAYGIGEGSASQGASYLHELDDVSIVPNELTAGQLLQYDGSFWVAIDKDEVGLNETELYNYLTLNNYATTEDLTWNNVQNKPETFHTTLSFIDDLHSSWDDVLKAQKPTTLAGYGITDAYTKSTADGRYFRREISTITSASADADDLFGYGAYINYAGSMGSFPNEYGLLYNLAIRDNDYRLQLYAASGGVLYYKVKFEALNSANWIRLLTTTSGNAVSATKLQTARTLWGRPFDGTDNVSGSLTGVTNITMSGYLQIGSARLQYDSANNAFYVQKSDGSACNFYSTGEVSAYGSGNGEGSTGKSYLHELEDVDVSNRANKDMLVYNSATKMWETIAMSDVQVDLPSWVTTTKPTYTWTEILNKPSWIGSTKPTYTAAEVGALSQTVADDRYIRQSIGSIGNNTDLNDYDSSGLAFISASSYNSVGNFPASSAYGYGILANLMIAAGRGIQWYVPDYDNTMAVRTAWSTDRWNNWHYLITNRNYTNWTVTKTGTNASGTWPISITGSASKLGTATVGSATSPIYLNQGVATAVTYDLNATLNSGISGKLAYYSSATAVSDYTSTIGSGTRLWYLNSGTPTNSSSTVGSNYIPVYLSSGTVTASTADYLIARGTFTYQTGNWNSGLLTGMFDISDWSGASNYPANSYYKYGTLLVVGEYSKTQFYFPHSSTNRAAWRTTYENSTSRWQAWHYLIDTTNYTSILDARYVKKTGDTMTGELTMNYDSTGTGTKLKLGSGISIIAPPSGSYSRGFLLRNHANTSIIATIAGVFGDDDNLFYTYYGGTAYDSPVMVITGDKKVGINTTSPTYELHVAGNMCSNAYYLPSSHGGFFWNSASAATWLQASTSGTLRFSGLNDTRLAELRINTVMTSMNGALYIENGGADNMLKLTRTDTTTSRTSIIYANSGGINGYIGVTGSGDSPAREPFYRYGTSSTLYKIYHSGNVTDLELRGYLMSPLITIDARNLNENTWYPVTIARRENYASCLYLVFSDLKMGGSTRPSWATHAAGFTVHLEWYTNESGWGICPVTYFFIRSLYSWCSSMPVRGVGLLTNSSTIYFYVRGGGLYYFRASHGTPTVTLRTSTYTVDSQSVSPTTTAPIINDIGWHYYENVSHTTSNWQVRINPANGSLYSTGEITAYLSSDRRLKTNIHNLDSIGLIRKLRPVEFDWTDEALDMKFDKTRHSYGLIALEVEKVLPDIVHYNMFGKDYLSLDYPKLIPLTISAIKEVDDEVTKLKKEVKELKKRLNKYERLNRLGTTRIDISDVSIVA